MVVQAHLRGWGLKGGGGGAKGGVTIEVVAYIQAVGQPLFTCHCIVS